MTDLDTPAPLTDWLQGTLTLVFSHGATVTRHLPLSTAVEVRQVAAGTREADRLGWWETGWLTFDREQVVFADFTLDEDGGWPLSADDRRTLDVTPYSRGVLVALRDYWQTQKGPEATYSARAIVTLHRNTLTNPTPEAWARIARALEGRTGADRVRDIYETVGREHSENDSEDDGDLEDDLTDDWDRDIDEHPATDTPSEAESMPTSDEHRRPDNPEATDDAAEPDGGEPSGPDSEPPTNE